MLKLLRELTDGKKQRRYIPSNRRKVIWYRDGKRCRYCKTKLQYHTFHCDHILPVYHGGNDYTLNLCAACPPCNMNKGANRRIVPRPLRLWRKVYGMILMIYFLDYPKPHDFY